MMKKKSLAKKFILGFLIFAILNTLALVAVGGFLYRKNIIEQYETFGYQIANIISSTVSEEEMTTISRIARGIYLGTASDEEKASLLSNQRFLRLQAGMDSSLEQFQAAGLIIAGMMDEETVDDYIKDPEGKKAPFYIIVDSSAEKEYKLNIGDPAAFAPRMMVYMKEAILTGERPPIHMINRREEGYFIQSFQPVSCGEGEQRVAFTVVLYMNDILSKLRDFVLISFLISVILSALFIFIYIKIQMKTLVEPIRLVSLEAGRFVEDELSDESEEKIITPSEKLLTVKTKDELEILGNSVYTMETGIRDYVSNLKRVTKEKERIDAELSAATQIQEEMLPEVTEEFLERKEFELYASMTPAREVGGDFYDFFFIDEEHLALVIADVSGKGMPAALFMVISKTMIKERAKQGGSPAQILMDVNNSLHAENRSKMFVSVWLGILTISTGVVVEANAGHEHPALKRGNGGFSLYVQRHGFVLGGRKGIKYREDEFTLEKGDVLFVYTDGIPEANNSNGEFFGTGRMLEALNQKKDASPKEMLDFLWEEAGIFVGEAPQFDDFTMLALKFNG